MLSLDPAKVLVVLVVALVVLGPDKLPRAARQLGAAWSQLRQWRARLEAEVRGTFPDLPPAHTIGEAVRSPLRFLDRLADEHGDAEGVAVPDAGAPDAGAPAPGAAPAAGGPLADGTGVTVADDAVRDGTLLGSGAVPDRGAPDRSASLRGLLGAGDPSMN